MTKAEKRKAIEDADLLPLRQRIAWMAGIWVLSVATLGLVSWLIRLWIV